METRSKGLNGVCQTEFFGSILLLFFLTFLIISLNECRRVKGVVVMGSVYCFSLWFCLFNRIEMSLTLLLQRLHIHVNRITKLSTDKVSMCFVSV